MFTTSSGFDKLVGSPHELLIRLHPEESLRRLASGGELLEGGSPKYYRSR